MATQTLTVEVKTGEIPVVKIKRSLRSRIAHWYKSRQAQRKMRWRTTVEASPKSIKGLPLLPLVYVFAASIRTGVEPDPDEVVKLARKWEEKQSKKERNTDGIAIL